MGHDGCTADDHGIMLADPEWEIGFTPDQDDSWKLYALGAVTLFGAFVAGLIVGRWL